LSVVSIFIINKLIAHEDNKDPEKKLVYDGRTILCELPIFTADDLIVIQKKCEKYPSVYKQILTDIEFARRCKYGDNDNDRTVDVNNLILTNKDPIDMSVVELCESLLSCGKGVELKTERVLSYIKSFKEKFMIALDSDVIHHFITTVSRMLKAFGKIMLRELVMSEKMTQQYNEMLTLFLTDVEECVDGVNGVCTCCGTPYTDIIGELDCIEDFVILTEVNENLLKNLRVTIQLPVLEEIWGFVKDGVVSGKEVEETPSYEDEDDVELGHWDEEEEGKDDVLNTECI
jgi:hypothetical protein